METNIENGNSQNAAAELDSLDPVALKELVVKERTLRTDFETKNKQLFERAKKAEGFEPDGEGNWIKTVERKSEKKPEAKAKKSDELDYGLKAYLQQNDVKPQEFEFFQEQMESSGLKAEELLKNGYFQSQLKERRDQKSAEMATPGNTRSSGEIPQSKPEWWVTQGKMPENTAENRQLRQEVLNLRLQREKSASQFSKSSVIFNNNG